MNIEFRQIRAFLVLAETRSFSEAARRFGLSQPAFSATIQRMEETMGMRLFHRTSRSVVLSAEGRVFLPRARNLMSNWSGVFEEMANLADARSGRVAVAALPSLSAGLISDIAVAFGVAHPGVRFDLHDVLHEEVVSLVRSGQADFGISVAPLDEGEIEFLPLLHDSFVAILPRDHALSAETQITWEALQSHALVTMTKATSVRRLIDQTLAGAGQNVRFLCEVNHLATIAGLVASGFGVSALPALCLPVVLRPEIIWRPLVVPDVWRTLGLLRLAQAPSVAAAAFLTELRQFQSLDVFAAFGGRIRFSPPPDSVSGTLFCPEP